MSIDLTLFNYDCSLENGHTNYGIPGTVYAQLAFRWKVAWTSKNAECKLKTMMP